MRFNIPLLGTDINRDIAIRQLYLDLEAARFPLRIIKPFDSSAVSDTVLGPDEHLFFAVDPFRRYYFRLAVFYDTNATADFKYGHTGPSNVGYYSIIKQSVTSGAPGHFATTLDAAYDTTGTAIVSTGTRGCIQLEGVLESGPDSGVWQFLWAQNTSNSQPTVVHRSSYLEVAET